MSGDDLPEFVGRVLRAANTPPPAKVTISSSAVTEPTTAEERAAKAICGRCPVALQCLRWAMGNGETEGVWGGYWMGSHEDRRKARKVVGM